MSCQFSDRETKFPLPKTTASSSSTARVLTTAINTTDTISDFMACIPLQIRVQIYSLVDDMYEPHCYYDYDLYGGPCSNSDERFDDVGFDIAKETNLEQNWESYDFREVNCLQCQIIIAAIMNDLEALHMLLPQFTNGVFESSVAIFLARFGHLTTLQWYHKKYGFRLTKYLLEYAAFGGHLHVIQWLIQQALSRGNSKFLKCRRIVQWIKQKFRRRGGIFDNKLICAYAACGGHFQLLKWLRKQGFRWGEKTCGWAAQNGHLEIVRYAHKHGCPWNQYTCKGAAYTGHLEILRYLHENGCPWDKDTCSMAAEGGHLEVLQYAREQGCPWNYQTIDKASSNGHEHIVQWAREHGCPEGEQYVCIRTVTVKVKE